VKEAGEQCDDGNTLPADGCSPTCQTEDPDPCPGTAITLTSAGLTVTGDTTGASNDSGETPCGGSASGDLVYHITAAQAGTVVATLTGNFTTHLYARSACPGNTASNLACSQTHGPATISLQVMAGDSFYLIVDGYGGQPEEGMFTLTLDLN
jgi:cysteine-rich repeat protein